MAIETTGRYGPRHYYDTANPDVHYPSVTAISGMLPKDLSSWHAKMAGERAVDSMDYLPRMVASSRDQTVKYIAAAAPDYTRAAIDKGNAGHDMFERMLRGERVDTSGMPEEYRAMHDNFADFLDRTQPELSRAEDIAWSDQYGYAGSFDVAWWLRGDPETGRLDPQGERLLHLSDYKTGNRPYPIVAVQLVAYAMAESVIGADDPEAVRHPSPTYDGLSVLHINEKVCTLKPVRPEVWAPAWETFQACIPFHHAAMRWQGYGWGYNRIEGVEDRAFGHSLYTKSGRLVTGTERRAA